MSDGEISESRKRGKRCHDYDDMERVQVTTAPLTSNNAIQYSRVPESSLLQFLVLRMRRHGSVAREIRSHRRKQIAHELRRRRRSTPKPLIAYFKFVLREAAHSKRLAVTKLAQATGRHQACLKELELCESQLDKAIDDDLDATASLDDALQALEARQNLRMANLTLSRPVPKRLGCTPRQVRIAMGVRIPGRMDILL